MSLGTTLVKKERHISVLTRLNENWQRETEVDGLWELSGHPRLREYLCYCEYFEKKNAQRTYPVVID